MTFTDFLSDLEQALDASPQAIPSESAAQSLRPLPHALYDPTCREAKTPYLILIGLGHWQWGDRPVEHEGICLNNKGIAERFGITYRYPTVTDLVLAPPTPLRDHWAQLTLDCRGVTELLRRFTLIVEDSGPDSCFALLCWLARCSGVDLAELATGNGLRWIQAVRQWESNGMIARGPDPEPLFLAKLPAETDLHLVPLAGGFAVLHQRGVLLFDDWRDQHLPVAELIEEVQRYVRWLGTLHKVDRHLAARRQADSRCDATHWTWQSMSVLTDLATQRSRLAYARDKNAPASPAPEVRHFRAQLTVSRHLKPANAWRRQVPSLRRPGERFSRRTRQTGGSLSDVISNNRDLSGPVEYSGR